MEIYDLFYKWVPVWVRLPVLFVLFFVILTANGIFLGNSTDMSGDIGVYSEVYTQSFNALYIGMGLGLLFHLRLKMRFTDKKLLLYGFTCVGLLNLVCATTHSPALFITACLLIGFTKITALTEVYIIWMLIWSKKMDTSRMYPFVYFTALSGLHFMTWFTSVLAYDYTWRYAYIWVLILVAVCIIFSLVFVRDNSLKRPLPLYQVDFIGLLLLGSSMMLVNYVAVNARVEDLFNSKEMVICFWAAIIFFLLFVLREINIKRPLFQFSLFTRKTFRIGIFLFAVLGFFSVGTFQSAFSAGTLHYDAARNMELNLYLVPGILIGCIFCYSWYYHDLDADILFIAGFLSFVAYHWILYDSFSNQFALTDFWLPSLLKGFGTALIYISVGLLTTKKLPLTLIMTGAGAMILVRSFIGSGICGGLYNFWFYQQRVRHFDLLAGSINAATLPAHPAEYFANLQQQASLAAAKEISGYVIIGGLILTTSLTLRYLYQKCRLN